MGSNTLLNGELNLQPNWMGRHFNKIRDMRLFDLAIPGTIGSGAYRRFVKEDKSNKLYLYSQEEDVVTQLLFGIRAFEFHVHAVKEGASFMS